MLSMGDLRHRQGRLDEAMRWTSEAIELAERMDEKVSLALGYQQLGELCAARGDIERFEASFARAAEILDLADLAACRAEGRERYSRVRKPQAEQQPGS